MRSARPSSSSSQFFTLVPNTPLETFVPVVLGENKNIEPSFQATLNTMTSSHDAYSSDVRITPEKRHIQTDDKGICGETPGGSKLICSSSKNCKIIITTPSGNHHEEITLYLLTREQHREEKKPSRVLSSLSTNNISSGESLSVKASRATKDGQPPRKMARREMVAVGRSAKDLVVDFFEKQNMGISREEIEKENWNLCHLLSYAIAMNGVSPDGKRFDTQTSKNLFSGTRVLNENMMRIENVLLELIKKDTVKEISYMAIHSEFTGSHILAKLKLTVHMTTHDEHTIDFEYPFDIADNRKLSPEFSTALYALLKSNIENTETKTNSNTPRFFTTPQVEDDYPVAVKLDLTS